MNARRVRFGRFGAAGFLAAALACAGCAGSTASRDGGLMWYRPPGKPPARPMSIAVGRAGYAARTGVTGRLGEARDYSETGMSLDRYGRSTEVRTHPWSPRPVAPGEHGHVFGRYRETGARTDSQGRSASLGSFSESGARYATGG